MKPIYFNAFISSSSGYHVVHSGQLLHMFARGACQANIDITIFFISVDSTVLRIYYILLLNFLVVLTYIQSTEEYK